MSSKLAHISDLHLGTEEDAVAEGLVRALHNLSPALLVVSGDLTQRARPLEFRQAREYLERLPQPQLVVPGNHDQPLYNWARRLFRPLAVFRRCISDHVTPVVHLDCAVVLGLDTTWRWVWKGGRLRQSHLDSINEAFTAAADRRLPVLVTHHPMLPAEEEHVTFPSLYGALGEGLKLIRERGPALLLAGHLHHGDAGAVHTTDAGSLLVVQAGTAISRRRREQPNAFNEIQLESDSVRLRVWIWNGKEFEPQVAKTYQCAEGRWQTAA